MMVSHTFWDTVQMNKLLTKISTWWTDLMEWMTSPWITFEKVRKSPWATILMIFFISQPVISLYVSTAQDIGWLKHKINPDVKSNTERITDLENQVKLLNTNIINLQRK